MNHKEHEGNLMDSFESIYIFVEAILYDCPQRGHKQTLLQMKGKPHDPSI